MTEREIQNRYYRQNLSRYLLLMPNTYPPKWWECDLMGITKAKYLYEFEIKLTVSDFYNDAKKGGPPKHWSGNQIARHWHYKTKHEKLADGCVDGPSKFWYIVPENLIPVEDIPSWAGLIYVTGEGRRARFMEQKKAVRLHKQKVGEDFLAQIAHNMYFRFWTERLRRENAGT